MSTTCPLYSGQRALRPPPPPPPPPPLSLLPRDSDTLKILKALDTFGKCHETGILIPVSHQTCMRKITVL